MAFPGNHGLAGRNAGGGPVFILGCAIRVIIVHGKGKAGEGGFRAPLAMPGQELEKNKATVKIDKRARAKPVQQAYSCSTLAAIIIYVW